jgi:hypothetical protein
MVNSLSGSLGSPLIWATPPKIELFELILGGPADRTVIGGLALHRESAHAAHVDGRELDVLSRFHAAQRILVHLGMDFFRCQGPCVRGLGTLFALLLGGLDVDRVHLFHLEGFAFDGGLDVIPGTADAAQVAQVIGGVFDFGKGIGAEDPGDVGEFLLFRLVSEGGVLHVGLAFAGKGVLQVFFGHFFHIIPPSGFVSFFRWIPWHAG